MSGRILTLPPGAPVCDRLKPQARCGRVPLFATVLLAGRPKPATSRRSASGAVSGCAPRASFYPCFPPGIGAYCDATTRFHELQGDNQPRGRRPATGKPGGQRLRRGATFNRSPAIPRPVWPPPWECGGKPPLLDEAIPQARDLVQKRGPVRHSKGAPAKLHGRNARKDFKAFSPGGAGRDVGGLVARPLRPDGDNPRITWRFNARFGPPPATRPEGPAEFQVQPWGGRPACRIARGRRGDKARHIPAPRLNPCFRPAATGPGRVRRTQKKERGLRRQQNMPLPLTDPFPARETYCNCSL